MYAATRGRFGKNVVLPRAFDYFILRAKSLKRDESFCLIFRENPTFAALPAALCLIFSLCALFQGSHTFMRANSLFPLVPFGILGAKTKIAISVFASYFLIIICAFQNRYFGLAHSICRIPATSAGEVARFNNMRALKASRNEGRALKITEKSFISLKLFS